MSNARNQGIPGIPIGALDAIRDENIRTVLRALVDGLNVRNGLSGKGDNAFVTRDELNKLQSNVDSTIKTTVQNTLNSAASQGGSTFESITPGAIDSILADLQAQIMNTELFRALGERVDLIDMPGGIFERLGETETVLTNETTARIEGDTALQTSISNMGVRVGNSETAIQEEISQRANADNAITESFNTQYAAVNGTLSTIQQQQITTANSFAALSSQTSTLQSTVNGHTSSISQESLARADADGKLFAQYTLKLDVNGNISGFGLASSPTGSDFIVRADRFSIVSSAYNKNTANPPDRVNIPFIVTTSNQTINGKVRPPGVWINAAAIAVASITKAMIGHASVDTLEIDGNAVTVPVGGSGYGTTLSATLTMKQPGKILVIAMANWISPPGAAAASGYLKTLCDNIPGPEVGVSMADQYSGSAVAIGGYDVGAGSHTVRFSQGVTGGARNLGAVGLFAIGLQR